MGYFSILDSKFLAQDLAKCLISGSCLQNITAQDTLSNTYQWHLSWLSQSHSFFPPAKHEAQSLLNPPALPTHFPPLCHHKHCTSQVDFLPLVPCAHHQCCVPTPPLSPHLPAVVIQPRLPAPTPPPLIVVCCNLDGKVWERYWHTCGSGEHCWCEEGFILTSCRGHKKSIVNWVHQHPYQQHSCWFLHV